MMLLQYFPRLFLLRHRHSPFHTLKKVSIGGEARFMLMPLLHVHRLTRISRGMIRV